VRAAPGLPLFCVVLALVGCGGDGGGQLSREDYVRQANEICDRFEDRLREAEQRVGEAETTEELGQVIDEALPTVREGFDELEALEPPDELQRDVDEWNRLNDESLEQLEELRDAANAGDESRLREIAEEGGETDDRSNEVARRIGADRCAEDD
jgi:hypothetical protein